MLKAPFCTHVIVEHSSDRNCIPELTVSTKCSKCVSIFEIKAHFNRDVSVGILKTMLHYSLEEARILREECRNCQCEQVVNLKSNGLRECPDLIKIFIHAVRHPVLLEYTRSAIQCDSSYINFFRELHALLTNRLSCFGVHVSCSSRLSCESDQDVGLSCYVS